MVTLTPFEIAERKAVRDDYNELVDQYVRIFEAWKLEPLVRVNGHFEIRK